MVVSRWKFPVIAPRSCLPVCHLACHHDGHKLQSSWSVTTLPNFFYTFSCLWCLFSAIDSSHYTPLTFFLQVDMPPNEEHLVLNSPVTRPLMRLLLSDNNSATLITRDETRLIISIWKSSCDSTYSAYSSYSKCSSEESVPKVMPKWSIIMLVSHF